MATQVRDDLVPDYGTQDADRTFDDWFETTFEGKGTGDGAAVESAGAGDDSRARSEAPAEDYAQDADVDHFDDEDDDDFFGEDDVDYSDLPPTWFERNKWKLLAGVAGLFAFVLIFTLLGGFGGNGDSTASERGEVKTPDQLSASDIVNRPTASTEVPDRPVLRDRSTETKQSTTRSSVAPRDIERGGSPYSTGEPTSGGNGLR